MGKKKQLGHSQAFIPMNENFFPRQYGCLSPLICITGEDQCYIRV